MARDDDELIFADEAPLPVRDVTAGSKLFWKLLVVDDDPEVHRITRLILSNYELDGRKLVVHSAYSSRDAKEVLLNTPDMAVVLLDVVMESDDAGLKLVRWIRDEWGNDLIRIILRTGQPGAAPERSVIRDYRINDYKAKTELTDLKLYTTVTVALRSWQDLRRLHRSEEGFRHIVAASGELVGNRSRERFYQGVLMQLGGLLDFDDDGLMIKAEGLAVLHDGQHLRVVAGTGAYADLAGGMLSPNQHRVVVELVNRAIKDREPFFAHDYFVMFMESADRTDNIILFRAGPSVSGIEQELLRVFATNVSLIFGSLDLNEHVEASQRELLVTLGEVVESRSSETGNHVRRVGEVAAMLAEALGMSNQDVEMIRVAAPMHDVGKMAIPDTILEKPGPLAPDEVLVMRQHTILGAQMLKGGGTGILAMAAEIARSHHERWDGTGYPDGTAGDAIPLTARIVAVCDVFDALYHARVYKPAWTLDTILDYFKAGRGTQFDPRILDVFLARIDKVMAIMERWPE